MRPSYLAGLLGVAAAVSYPTPTGIKLAVFGDSRTSSNEEQSGSSLADRQPATSYAYWLCAALGYAVDLVGVYGVNTDTIEGLNTRLTAAGIAKQTNGSSTPLIDTIPPSRGFAANGTYSPAVTGTAPANGPIKIAVVLIGVNNTTEVIATVGPKYQTLLDALDAQGWVIVLCNEIPSNRNDGGQQPHLDRRAWLDAAVLTSTNAMLKVNTWDALKHPSSVNMCAGGLYSSHMDGAYDGQLHPNTAGNKILGETIAAAMQLMMTAAGYPARGAAATTATSLLQYAAMTGTAGTVTAGTNLNGSGATLITGAMPDGWTVDVSGLVTTLNTGGLQDGTNGNLTIALSQYTDGAGYGHLVVTGTGRVGTSTAGISTLTVSRAVFKSAAALTNVENGLGVVDGDVLYGTAELSVPAGSVGFLGAAVLGQASSTAYNTYTTGGLGTKAAGTGNWSGLAAALATWAGIPAVSAKRILTSGRKLPVGFTSTVETKTISAQVQIAVQQGISGAWQVDISHLGLVKNI